MVFVKLHICHDLVLYQNVNYNAYSTPLLHEALDVNHKMVVLVIGWYHNTFSHLCVQQQQYPEHDTLCLSIFLTGYFPVFSLINDSMFTMLLRQMFLEFFSQTEKKNCVQECIGICELNIFDPVNLTLSIN